MEKEVESLFKEIMAENFSLKPGRNLDFQVHETNRFIFNLK